MIFERAYGQWLVAQLNESFKKFSLTCKQYDEVAYKPLRNNPDEIAVIISGGNAAMSNVLGMDQNVLPLTVTIICKQEYSSTVRQVVENVQKEYNATPLTMTYWDSVEGKNIQTKHKSVFNTPFIFDENNYQTKIETIQVAFITFSATVSYGATSVVYTPIILLDVTDESRTQSYHIEHISTYDLASIPAYDTTLCQGQDRPSHTLLSKSNSMSITIVKVEGNTFQTNVLKKELIGKNGLAEKALVLSIDGEDIAVKTYQLIEHYENNTSVYVLTFGF